MRFIIFASVLLAVAFAFEQRSACARGPYGFDGGVFKSDSRHYFSGSTITSYRVIHSGEYLGLQFYYNGRPGEFFGNTISSSKDREAVNNMRSGEYITKIKMKWWTRGYIKQVYRIQFKTNRGYHNEYRVASSANVPNSAKHEATIDLNGRAMLYFGAREQRFNNPYGNSILAAYFYHQC